MSENSINFKFFSPLTTPTVARCKLAQQKKKEADLICNFSSDSDNSSIFITRSKAKEYEVIKQPRRLVIESIITSLDSVDSDSGSENLFASNLKATKHRKKKTKTIKRPPCLINSELSYVYSDCEKSSPVKKFIVSADKTNKCSSHKKSYSIQSDNRTRLSSELPVSNFNLNLKSSSSSPDHGKSLSSESNDNYAPGKSKLNIRSGRRKMSSRSSSESDLIFDESVDSIIGSGARAGLTSSERKHSGTSHVTSYMHQNSSSESEPDEQKGSKNSTENIQSKLPQKMKINSQPQKKHRHKRMSSSSSDSESDLDDKKSKPTSTKGKISSIVQASITASTDVSKGSPLKGKHLSGSKCVVDTVSDYISESESGSDGHTSPVIQKQNIKKHVTESHHQSTVMAPVSPSSEIEAGRSKSTNQSRKAKRFQCPEGFEEVVNIGDTILPIKKWAKKEFWLIKTPWDFDISKLERATIPLAGSIKLPVTEGAKHFEVMAIPKSKEEVLKMGILLADNNLDSLVYGPSLAGQIHVIESSASLPLAEIQAQPKTRHQIPKDLKQRHVPFGAECPLQTMKTNGMAGEKKGGKRKHEEVEKRKKKKKRRKIEG
ncbi:hypothetical protein CHS0354_029869 [Potamilus streckersoni]|uniref:Uncharacterized protein n=1 Tax=Potamilus streckersoni TaxID=2493646 RepID=A0AAE0TH21_9BIVA|nr:hypothetical protein CHS0354_029869 [Potamilus streckersoni]